MLSHILRSYFKILLIDGQQTHYEIIVMIHKPIQESCSVAKMTARCALYCRDITGRLTMQTSLGLPEDPII